MSRRWFADLPVGRKLVVIGVCASLVALAVSSGIFLLSTFVSLRQNIREQLEIQAAIVADNVGVPLAFSDAATAVETLSALKAAPDIDLACLYGVTGARFAAFAGEGGVEACPPSLPPDWEREDSTVRVIRRVMEGDRHLGTLYLRGNFDQARDRLLAQMLAAFAGVLLGVLAAIWLSKRIQRLMSGPIVALSSTAARITAAGDYSLRATRSGNDEVGVLVDDFNRMVAEVERRDDQLRGANQMKDEFLAALSHELRTPLNAVLGWIQVLHSARQDRALTERAVASIERNARTQARLIEDLLDISRIVTGKLNIASAVVDITAVLRDSLDIMRGSADAKRLDVVTDMLPSPQWVNGDSDRLQQIFWNLLSNAVRFSSPRGTITVSLQAEDDHYLIKVRDGGIGLAPEFLPHVFDRFRQADGSLTRAHGGLGLGLAIARELTELHGGTISAESAGLGQGATFTVSLPRLSRAPMAARHETPMAEARLDGVKVLVVDDDDDSRELLRLQLASTGADVALASSGPAALRSIAVDRPDLVLCDLSMPGMDGYQMIREHRIRENGGNGRGIPAIAVSAHAGTQFSEQAIASGFQAFVSKPFDFDVLLTRIRSVLADTTPTSPQGDRNEVRSQT